jgi:tetratricopeptide (TPR) repeat protein
MESVRAAIPIYKRIIATRSKLGETANLALGYGYLATLLAAVSEYDEAERLFSKADAILAKKNGPAVNRAWLHNNRGLARLKYGQYAGALESFRLATAALSLQKEQKGSQWRFLTLQNTASAYVALGNPAEAESAFLETLDVLESSGRRGSDAHQAARANLAIFYARLGDLETSRVALEKLLAERALSRSNRRLALYNLGHVLSARREFAKAEARMREAQALTRKGTEWYTTILVNRAALYNRSGRFDLAAVIGEEAYRRVGLRYGEDSAATAAILHELAVTALNRNDLAKAERLLMRATSILAKDSSKEEAFVTATRTLALVLQRRGEHDRAVALSREALEVAKKHLARMLAFGSEAQRLAYLSEAAPYDQLAALGEPNLLAEAVLTMKGAVLESLLAERALVRASSRTQQVRLDRINELKVAIMEKIGRGEGKTEALERALKAEQTTLARTLAPRLRQAEAPARLQDVQAELDHDQVLVEIIRYQHQGKGGALVSAYGGLVIPRTGTPTWIPLGDGRTIDDGVERIVGRFGGGRGPAAVGPDASVADAVRDLHDRVWKPLARAFSPATRKVLLSPDGSTAFVPWAALLDDEGRFVAERWELAQIGSGRDVLRAKTTTPAPVNTFVGLGDGADDLAFSRQEVEYAGAVARKNGLSPMILLGECASERALFRHARPRILHVATHGDRLRGGVDKAVHERLSRNPMYRAYLLLGGGTITLDAWRRGSVVPFAADGILTAEEASTLDLRDTWLAVLSACHTGDGDVRTGEGVIGLRRGFALAGTENLLLSLWAVDDRATSEFMKAFYDRLFKSDDPSHAFHTTQRAELLRWKRELGVDDAVHRAGAFVLTR